MDILIALFAAVPVLYNAWNISANDVANSMANVPPGNIKKNTPP